MRMRKTLFVILAVILALTAAACSNPAGNTSATTRATQEAQTPQLTPQGGQARQDVLIEPTQLISKADASDILGVAMNDAWTWEQPEVGEKLCLYELDERMLQVTLIQPATVPSGGVSPEDQYRTIEIAFDDAEKAEGIGDEACFATPGLHILKDGYYISIDMGNSDDETIRNMLKEAGITAVKNLEKILGGQ